MGEREGGGGAKREGQLLGKGLAGGVWEQQDDKCNPLVKAGEKDGHTGTVKKVVSPAGIGTYQTKEDRQGRWREKRVAAKATPDSAGQAGPGRVQVETGPQTSPSDLLPSPTRSTKREHRHTCILGIEYLLFANPTGVLYPIADP